VAVPNREIGNEAGRNWGARGFISGDWDSSRARSQSGDWERGGFDNVKQKTLPKLKSEKGLIAVKIVLPVDSKLTGYQSPITLLLFCHRNFISFFG